VRDRQTDRHTDGRGQYTFRLTLRHMRNVISCYSYWCAWNICRNVQDNFRNYNALIHVIGNGSISSFYLLACLLCVCVTAYDEWHLLSLESFDGSTKQRVRPMDNFPCFDTGNGRFPDNHFPRQMFPRQVVFRTRPFLDKTFPGRLRAWLVDYFAYKTFPGQSLSQTHVSHTICINDFDYFGMFM